MRKPGSVLVVLLIFISVLGACVFEKQSRLEPDLGRHPSNETTIPQDTLTDYARARDVNASRVMVTLPPAAMAESITPLLKLFEEYRMRATTTPGRYVKGQLQFGANEREYVPSTDELVLAEIGERLFFLMGTSSQSPIPTVQRYLNETNKTLLNFSYNDFDVRHVDVMGTGRFYYVSKPIPSQLY